MRRFTQTAFALLYNRLAWVYDAVAWLASLGEWERWGGCALPFLVDGVLELAHGPGHLHAQLRQRFEHVVGIDLSRQMGLLALRNLSKSDGWSPALARANAMRLPFADGAFACVVSTFPAPFIFATATLSEARRVLAETGRLVIVPGATFSGNTLPMRALSAIYRLTGQGTADTARVAAHLAAHGFALTEHTTRTRHADVTVWGCEKRRTDDG